MADLKRKAVNTGLGVLAFGATYLVGKKVLKEIRKNRSERRFSEEGQQANLLYSAMNRTGMSWLRWIDGTDEDNIYIVASTIKNFKKVQREYKNLYDRSLVTDLQKELSTVEYRKFMTIINNGGTPTNEANENPYSTGPLNLVSTDTITGRIILVEKPTRIYNKLTWYPFGSVKKVNAKTYIPSPVTGMKEMPKSGFQKLQFLEVMIRTAEGNINPVYILKNAVKLVPKNELPDYYGQYQGLVFHDNEF